MTNNLDMRRNLAPSRTGIPSLHQRIGVAFPQGFVPPIRNNVGEISKTNTGIHSKDENHGKQSLSIVHETSQNDTECTDENTRYFNAVWCKQSTRKHKKWEGDALLVIKANVRLAILRDAENGKEISRGSSLPLSKICQVENGSMISFGGKEIEIMDEISFGQYKRCLSICNQHSINDKKRRRST